MKSRHICPCCGNTERFITTAHVVQSWIVDGEGNFIEELSTDETLAEPDDDNVWTCEKCGAEAVAVKGGEK